VNRSIRYAAELNLVYLNNPKAGCSTIKYSLWMAIDALRGSTSFAGNVHARKKDPFARNVFALSPAERASISAAPMFSVVRNPFTRALAAYLDKIPDDLSVWTLFSERIGLKPEVTKKELPFADFVRLISAAPGELLDGHFRPQSDNLLLPFARPCFIGFLENMKPVEEFLERNHVLLQDHRTHATNSSGQIDHYYDSGSIDLIRKKYAGDFAQLGYSDDSADANSFVPARTDSPWWPQGDDLVLSWIGSGEAPPGAEERGTDFANFERASGTEDRLQILRSALKAENDWSHLARYARFVRRRVPKDDVREALDEKMMFLRARYREAVANPDIFRRAPYEAGAARRLRTRTA
jgi:hypothetical protein